MQDLMRHLWKPFVIATFVTAAGCGGGGSSPVSGSPSPAGGTVDDGPDLVEVPKSAPKEVEPQTGGNFLSSFPTGRIVSGGVGKDGIPALTDPVFVSANSAQADYVRDNDIVMGLMINGEAKAYPHNIGWWHEIVNDRIGGQSVVVSLCPLTGTGMVFNGEDSDGSRIELGVSGNLFNNNLVMYDRRESGGPDDTYYPQMIYKAVSGRRKDSELQLLPVIETTWRFWKQLYPSTTVVSDRTGFSRSYVTYPYGAYREPATGPSFSLFPSQFDNPLFSLLQPKEMVLGIRFGEIAMAYPFGTMASQAVINETVDGNPIAVVYEKERLALAYSRDVDGRVLTLERAASTDSRFPFEIRDDDSGTTWNLLGEGIDGPLSSQRLEQVPAHNAFWFAWATFWQNTGVH